LYQQVKHHVLQNIHTGEWRPGDRIPSENEFVAELGVSRMTVHRALREMAEHGILARYAGVGTFVAEERPQSGLLRAMNFANEIRARGHDYACDVIRVARESANLEVATALGLEIGHSVFHTLCVHRENGVPIQLEDRYVNPRAAPDFITQDFHHIQPSEYLVKVVPLEEVEHVVEAVPATPEEAELLEIRAAQPCLVLTRRTWSNQMVVTFVKCIHPGSRYRLGSRFQVSGQQWFG
jgi:GntR family histidine utilization transcriptional repressor